jgi:hypothetical protein
MAETPADQVSTDHRVGLLHYVAASQEKKAPRFRPSPTALVPINLCDPDPDWGSVQYAIERAGKVSFLKTNQKNVWDAWVVPGAQGAFKIVTTARIRNISRGYTAVQVARPVAALALEAGRERKAKPKAKPKAARERKVKPKEGAKASPKTGPRAKPGRKPKTAPETGGVEPLGGAEPAPVAPLPESGAEPETKGLDPAEAKKFGPPGAKAALPAPGAVPPGFVLLPDLLAKDALKEATGEGATGAIHEAIGSAPCVELQGDEMLRLVYVPPEPGREGEDVEGDAVIPHWSLDVYNTHAA